MYDLFDEHPENDPFENVLFRVIAFLLFFSLAR
jgi:hypothetical protein